MTEINIHPAEQDLVDRFMKLSAQRDAAYRGDADEGLTPEQAKYLEGVEAEIDRLYPQLPKSLRDSWET